MAHCDSSRAHCVLKELRTGDISIDPDSVEDNCVCFLINEWFWSWLFAVGALGCWRLRVTGPRVAGGRVSYAALIARAINAQLH